MLEEKKFHTLRFVRLKLKLSLASLEIERNSIHPLPPDTDFFKYHKKPAGYK